MPQKLRISLFVGIATGMLAAAARADGLPVETFVAPACVALARELEPRLERALQGPRAAELKASVAIEDAGSGYRVTITLLDDRKGRGQTVIVAPTCDEALDAAVVVLALAFGGRARSRGRGAAVAACRAERIRDPSGSAADGTVPRLLRRSRRRSIRQGSRCSTPRRPPTQTEMLAATAPNPRPIARLGSRLQRASTQARSRTGR